MALDNVTAGCYHGAMVTQGVFDVQDLNASGAGLTSCVTSLGRSCFCGR